MFFDSRNEASTVLWAGHTGSLFQCRGHSSSLHGLSPPPAGLRRCVEVAEILIKIFCPCYLGQKWFYCILMFNSRDRISNASFPQTHLCTYLKISQRPRSCCEMCTWLLRGALQLWWWTTRVPAAITHPYLIALCPCRQFFTLSP